MTVILAKKSCVYDGPLRCVTEMEARLHISLISVLRRCGLSIPHSDNFMSTEGPSIPVGWAQDQLSCAVENRIETRFLGRKRAFQPPCRPNCISCRMATLHSYKLCAAEAPIVMAVLCTCRETRVCPAVDSLSPTSRRGKHLTQSEQPANDHSQNYLKSPNPKEEFALFFEIE